MTAEQWATLRHLLDQALDAPEERPILLSNLRAHDPELCGELERLVADVASDEDADRESGADASDLTGQTIGPYVVIREIGRGGAGTVVLAARQEGRVEVRAALKLLRRDFLRGAPRGAFLRELRVLARLDHANIARLMDWGVVPGGMLYLALEYVDGLPITQYCAENKLKIRERLALFQQVCDAVEHAHRNLVVHRDLKPSNILVAKGGRVKLVDFGIAAELDTAAEATTMMRRSLTPAYASPEQIEGRPVTVATDIYSLGLVLYELLTGCLPHPAEADKFWAAILQDPAPPSKRARLPEVTARDIEGDLNGIVLKAIQPEPDQRYRSVEQLAGDIRRYLEGRPVMARQGSRIYVAGRFLRRNRLNVIAAALAIGALTATAAVAAWKWREANRNLAESERSYRELSAFAGAVLSNVDAGSAASPTEQQRRMSETIATYLDRLSKSRGDDEDLQLQIANAYGALATAQGAQVSPNQGDTESAMANYQASYRICLRLWRASGSRNSGNRLLIAVKEIANGTPDPATAAAFVAGGIHETEGLLARYPKDIELLKTYSGAYGSLAQRTRLSGDSSASIGYCKQAIGFADRALALRNDDVEALNLKEGYTGELGNALRLEGKFEDALRYQTEARQIAQRAAELQPASHTKREHATKLLAESGSLYSLKKYPEAMRDARAAIVELEGIANQDPANDGAKADLSQGYARKGDIEVGQGQADDAVRSHEEALRLRSEIHSHHPSNLQALKGYQSCLMRTGEVLVAAHRDALAMTRFRDAATAGAELLKSMPSDVTASSAVARAYLGEAGCARRAGNLTEAAGLYRQSLSLLHETAKRSPLDVGLAALIQRSERAQRDLEQQFSAAAERQ